MNVKIFHLKFFFEKIETSVILEINNNFDDDTAPGLDRALVKILKRIR